MSPDGQTFCRTHFRQARARVGSKLDPALQQAASAAQPVQPDQARVHLAIDNPEPTSRSITLPAAEGLGRAGLRPPLQCAPGESCERCGKAVFAMERITGNRLVFHKTCFRCAACSTLLRPGNWELDGGTLLCRAHYLARRAAPSIEP